MIQIATLEWVPEMSRGFVRDLRVRWALEEAGIPYTTVVLSPAERRTQSYRAWQPFGQVPAFRCDGVEMFESGAIVLWLAGRSERLCPPDDRARVRMASWVLAAVDTLGSRVDAYTALDAFHAGEAWTEQRRPQLRAVVEERLACVAAHLRDRDYLEDVFTAGDLMVSFVLRELVGGGLLEAFPTLLAYQSRCERRPAFQRALQAQLSELAHAPPG